MGPCTARKGDTTVSLGLIVPAKLERDVDAAWRQHEQWMRKTHDFGEGVHGKFDDLAKPRITDYTVTKAYEHVDPMDPNSTKTGKVRSSPRCPVSSRPTSCPVSRRFSVPSSPVRRPRSPAASATPTTAKRRSKERCECEFSVTACKSHA